MIYKPSQGLISAGGFRLHPRYKGCIGHWVMKEGGGLQTADVSGFNKNGTLTTFTSTPFWTNGIFGPAIGFDGNGAHVESPSVNWNFNVDKAFTLSAWINVIDTNVRAIMGQCNSGLSLATFYFRLGSTSGFHSQVTGYNEISIPSVSPNVFHHVALVYTGTNLYYYLNGILTTQGAASGFPEVSSNFSRIGRLGDYPSGQFLAGTIDEVRVYNRGLSSDEITSLFKYPFLEFKHNKYFDFRRISVPPLTTPGVLSQTLGTLTLLATGTTVAGEGPGVLSQTLGALTSVATGTVLIRAVAQASSITLAWDASVGATGYKIYVGTTSGVYDYGGVGSPFDVGNVLIYTLQNFPDDTYYFAVKAYNENGESGFSSEISDTIVATDELKLNLLQLVSAGTLGIGSEAIGLLDKALDALILNATGTVTTGPVASKYAAFTRSA